MTCEHETSAKDLKRFSSLSKFLDTQFGVPFLPFRIGLDGILGLIPGVGDLITGSMGLYAIKIARTYKLPWHVHARILKNLAIDTLIGAIPLVGDIFDMAFYAHRKNFDLLDRHIAHRQAKRTG